MEIIVPFSIRKRELDGKVSGEAKKIFTKIQEKPDLAAEITAKDLPDRTTLHKLYATTPGGARRLLFFCRHAPPPALPKHGGNPLPSQPERWVLLFYRSKGDRVGDNMSHKNPDFVTQLEKNMKLALSDVAASTSANPLYEQF